MCRYRSVPYDETLTVLNLSEQNFMVFCNFRPLFVRVSLKLHSTEWLTQWNLF